MPEEGAVPGAVIAIQTFGDLLGFNPHCHILATDGCFYGNGMFRVAPSFEVKDLEEIFQHKLLKMLLSKGKITQDLINMLSHGDIQGSMYFVGQESNQEMIRLWRTWLAILSGHLSPRKE